MDGVFDACRELGISFVAYSPMGRGFLTGAFGKETQFEEGDMRRVLPRFSGDNFERNLAVLPALQAIAREKGCTPAQLALAAILAKEPFTIVIPGTHRPERIDENAAAAQANLSSDDLARLDAILPPDVVVGERYTAEGMKGVGV